MHEEADRQPHRVAVDQRQLRLQHLDAVLRVVEPAPGDAPAQPGEQRRGALLQPDQRHAGHHRQPEPDLQRHRQRRIRRARQQDAETDGGEGKLGEEFGGDIDHGGGGCQRPRHAVQCHRPGAEHEAADLGERQAVGRGVAHHAAPDEDPGAARLARRRDRVPGQAEHQRTARAASRRSARNPPSRRGARRRCTRPNPNQPISSGAEQQASQGKRDRELLQGVGLSGWRRRAGGSTPIQPHAGYIAGPLLGRNLAWQRTARHC